MEYEDNALTIVHVLGGVDEVLSDPAKLRLAELAAKLADEHGIDFAVDFLNSEMGNVFA